MREHLEESSNGCTNINEERPVFRLSLDLELLINLLHVTVKHCIRELVLLNCLGEAFNMAASMEDD
jgi:hypothetical protein